MSAGPDLDTFCINTIRRFPLTPSSWRRTFGASAPLKALQKHFGFEPDRLVAVAKEQLGRR